MSMYSALVYPETAEGSGYTRPPIPATFVSFAYISPTWNPYSANAVDRTEYWIDTAGTLTEAQVDTLCNVTVNAAKLSLSQTDEPFVRGLEDLITTLVAKGMIALTDLPAEAQTKLAARQNLRNLI